MRSAHQSEQETEAEVEENVLIGQEVQLPPAATFAVPAGHWW